jgi:molybdopterin-guanine dinucleotide biosynthesis protein
MIIVVGGNGSGSGKTTLIRIILKLFPSRFAVVKITPGRRFGEGIEEDFSKLNVVGKDTYYFLHEGAKKVSWVKGDIDKLNQLLKKLLSKNIRDVIIEGNSFLNFKKPDLLFFVERDLSNRKDDQTGLIKSAADYVIINVVGTGFIKNLNEFRVNLKNEIEAGGEFSSMLKEIIESRLNFKSSN